MTPNENAPPPVETPSPAPASADGGPRPPLQAAEPPAAALVRDGLDAAEALALRRELEAALKARADAESGRRSAETKAAEAERHAQELKALQMAAPAPKAVPPKAKRGFPTFMNHPWDNN